MTAVNRTSLFNTTLQFIGDAGGRTRKVPKPRQVTVVTAPNSQAAGARYFMRGWDSGLLQWVQWGPFNTILTTPSSTQTTPNFTGTLSIIHVVSGP